MLETIKIPGNLMNLTNNLPGPNYVLKENSGCKNQKVSQTRSSEKLAKTKYKSRFKLRSEGDEHIFPKRKLLKTKNKHKELTRNRLSELKVFKRRNRGGSIRVNKKRTSKGLFIQVKCVFLS